ncbi:hypothetical protein V3C99_011089 [Haemonchus contortus]
MEIDKNQKRKDRGKRRSPTNVLEKYALFPNTSSEPPDNSSPISIFTGPTYKCHLFTRCKRYILQLTQLSSRGSTPYKSSYVLMFPTEQSQVRAEKWDACYIQVRSRIEVSFRMRMWPIQCLMVARR